MRNLDITYTKAIGILLMVLCHAGAAFWNVNKVIYMFHMPLFFFFSGYCLKTEYFNTPLRFVKKRIKGLYWPYLKWSLLFLALHNVFVSLGFYPDATCAAEAYFQPYTPHDFLVRALGITVTMKGHDPLLGGYWFMRTLLTGSLIAFAILWTWNKINRKIRSNYSYGLLVGGGYNAYNRNYSKCFLFRIEDKRVCVI